MMLRIFFVLLSLFTWSIVAYASGPKVVPGKKIEIARDQRYEFTVQEYSSQITFNSEDEIPQLIRHERGGEEPPAYPGVTYEMKLIYAILSMAQGKIDLYRSFLSKREGDALSKILQQERRKRLKNRWARLWSNRKFELKRRIETASFIIFVVDVFKVNSKFERSEQFAMTRAHKYLIDRSQHPVYQHWSFTGDSITIENK